jgi:hypothetical protein
MKSSKIETWDNIIRQAKEILASQDESSLDILINLIKQINPTPHLNLSPEQKENAYKLKSDLQSLLLKQYGNLFDLEPVLWDENIVLIRHKLSLSVNACHAKLHTLSRKALAQLRIADDTSIEKGLKRKTKKAPIYRDINTFQDLIEKAKLHIDNFEYDSAQELLSTMKTTMKIENVEELPLFLRGISILADEIGAYDAALDLLFYVPKDLLNDNVREITANICCLNQRFSDARGLFEECAIRELKKESMFRYADILHREGETRGAFDVLMYADSLNGSVQGMSELKQDICKILQEEALPFWVIAKNEFDLNNFNTAEDAAKTALEIFPEYSEARELLKFIREIRDEETVRSLWQQYGSSENHSDKLRCLRKLQIKDHFRKNEIADLIEQEIKNEKIRQQEMAIHDVLECLRKHALEESFDRLYPLLRNEALRVRILKLVEDYPSIKHIVNSDGIVRLQQREAKECLLSFLQLKELSIEHEVDKALSLLKKSRRAFHDFPEYIEISQKVNTIAIEQSRKRIQEYLSQLRANDVSFDDAERIIRFIRKSSSVLPKEETEEYESMCQKTLLHLQQVNSSSYHLTCLRKCLLLGDSETAHQHKKKINDPRVTDQIENEVQSLFAVEREHLNVTYHNCNYSDYQVESQGGRPSFVSLIDDEVFFSSEDDKEVVLFIFNLNNLTTQKVKMINYNYSISKVFHADAAKGEYHLLCVDGNNQYHYFKLGSDMTQASIKSHINISDLLGMGANSSIDNLFHESHDYECLYILYCPDDDNFNDRIIAAVDLQKAKIVRQKEVDCFYHAVQIIPSNPVRIIVGENKLQLYDEKLRKVKHIEMDEEFEYYDSIIIDKHKKLIYVFFDKGSDHRYAFAVLDYDLNIQECHEDISPKYNFNTEEKQYDSSREILIVGGFGRKFLHDCRGERTIKNFAEVDFCEDDFIIPPLTAENLCREIRDDRYDISFQTPDNTINRLNEILSVPNLYERVLQRKSDIHISEYLSKLEVDTRDMRSKKFSELEAYEKNQIKEFNRGLLEELYPDAIPKIKHIINSSYFKTDSHQYLIFDYLDEIKQLIVTDTTPLIDKVLEIYNNSST